MKRLIVAILLIAFVAVSIPTASSVPAVTQSLNIILTKQSPFPVQPDQIADIEVSLQNTGYGEAENIILEVLPKNPFILVPGQEAIKSFSRVPAQDHVTATYKLYVDKNAITNGYELEFNYYQTGTDVKTTGKVIIQVQGVPKLVVEKIETQPENIEPGDSVEITAFIKNVGTGSASFMEASLVSNTSYILPVLSGGLDYIGEIKPGETGQAKFEMSIDNAAEYQTYPGIMSFSYKDESGNSQVNTFAVGIPIRGKPIIDILSAKIDGSDFKVDIENIGTANAKALKILLIQGGKTVDSAIANELRPAKSKTVRFTGFEYGQAAVNISYLDESNQFFSEEYPVSINPSSASSQESSGGGLSPLVPVLIVVVVLESYYVWRLRKRAKK